MPALSKLYSRGQIDQMRDDLIKKDGNFCGICKKPRSHFKNNFALDHNHKTDRVRGLLCYRCNKFMLGRHTIESATAILNYLLKYDVPAQETAINSYRSKK